MDQAAETAAHALAEAAKVWNATGVTSLVQSLVGSVWATNVDRFEPDELYDTPRSLGVQCSENIRERAVAMARESPEWQGSGLRVTTARSTLCLTVAGWATLVMKVPSGQARRPRWDGFDWASESNVRLDAAKRNSQTLGGYRSSWDDPLPLPVEPPLPRLPRDLLLVWAGEEGLGVTAGWLTVPVLGARPFAATRLLWWDDSSASGEKRRTVPDQNEGFDRRPEAVADLSIKRQPPAAGGLA